MKTVAKNKTIHHEIPEASNMNPGKTPGNHWISEAIVIKSNPSNRKNLKVTLSEFINALGEEFFCATGYGVYAHISFPEIDRLYSDYLQQSSPVRDFAIRYIRSR